MNLPPAPDKYDRTTETKRNTEIERADRFNQKTNADVIISPPQKLVLVSPAGTQFAITIDDNGVVTVADAVAVPRPAFSAHKNSTDQTISIAALDQKLTFGTEAWDDGGYYDAANSKWTPPAGLVRLTACVLVTSANIVDQVQHHISIWKNGSLLKIGDVVSSSGTTNIAVCVDIFDKASGTDYYEATIAIASLSGNRTVSGNPSFTYFQGVRL